MSTDTLTSPTVTEPHDNPPTDDVRVTFPRVVRSEWIKFRTLRSTIWTLGIMLLLMVGIVTLFSGILASQGTQRGGPTSIDVFTIAASLASLAVVVLGDRRGHLPGGHAAVPRCQGARTRPRQR